MPRCLFCAILFAACTSSRGGSKGGEPIPLTKVVFRQYYAGSPIFVLESLSGRDIVKLRSRPASRGEIKPAYVPDDVMSKMLSDFEGFGYYEHSGARPPDPRKVGGRAELTIIGQGRHRDARGRPVEAFIRRDGQGAAAYRTYKQCLETFRAVHAHFGKFQAAAGGSEFGVKKAEFER